MEVCALLSANLVSLLAGLRKIYSMDFNKTRCKDGHWSRKNLFHFGLDPDRVLDQGFILELSFTLWDEQLIDILMKEKNQAHI